MTYLNTNVEHLTFHVNQKHMWGTHLNLQIGEVSYVTKTFLCCNRQISGNIMWRLNFNSFIFHLFYYDFASLFCIEVNLKIICGL
jgi:hypothetical protein